MLQAVIIASAEPAHEVLHPWTLAPRLCYDVCDSSHWICIYGAFPKPSGDVGAVPSVLLPVGTVIRGDGTEAAGEFPSLQTCSLFERRHVHVPLYMTRVRQEVFSSLHGSFSIYTSSSCDKLSCWRWITHVESYPSKHSIRN